ncbi:hypothetical protein UFOVP29_223 [uncultured Caudovirales phage]|uniref:Uncharacterized protein n=1 Tax=uncultured Caudovirales phage TaxID=2100421 RepID=A0A6J5KLB9_9CAUD|nr:hypothetical protein UFOVP29_223 [uncultured Caudovirales phage]
MRVYIDTLSLQEQLANEAMPVGLGQRLKTGLQQLNPFSREKRAQAGGQAVAQKSTNQWYAHLVSVMGSQGVAWNELTWKQVANYLRKSKLAITPAELVRIAAKLQSGPMSSSLSSVPFTATPINMDVKTAQKIVQMIMQLAISTYLSRGNLGDDGGGGPLDDASSDATPSTTPTTSPTQTSGSQGPSTLSTNSKIPVGSTINRPEGQFVKTATGWVSKASGRTVISGKAKSLDAQMMSVLQRRGLSESRKPVHVRFVRSARKKV